MTQAIISSERNIIKNMSFEEMAEIVKEIPASILYNELEYRATLNQEKLERIKEVANIGRD